MRVGNTVRIKLGNSFAGETGVIREIHTRDRTDRSEYRVYFTNHDRSWWFFPHAFEFITSPQWEVMCLEFLGVD